MKKIVLLLILGISLSNCDNLSKEDKENIKNLTKEADTFRMNGNLENAKSNYIEILKIDQSNSPIRYSLVGAYIEQDSLNEATQVLENLPPKNKNTIKYYWANAELSQFKGNKTDALKFYKKAYGLIDKVNFKTKEDLNALINYTMAQTFAGEKNKAVKTLDSVISLNWLNKNDKDFLRRYRNEFEFYTGKGNLDFQSKKDTLIKTANPDSLEIVLMRKHINISGSSSNYSDSTIYYFSNKFKDSLRSLDKK